MRFFDKKRRYLALSIFIILMIGFVGGRFRSSRLHKGNGLTMKVEKRSFPIEVRAVGELDTARSTVIFSSIRGDLGKIIYLVPDGSYVNTGDILVKIDSTPYEERREKIKAQLLETEGAVKALRYTLEWENEQASHEQRVAQFDVDAAKLELDKLVHGDGPMEIARLKSQMQKAKVKYEELLAYSDSLQSLQGEGFLLPAEIKLAEKKLADEQESYETSQSQYHSYINHTHPMQVKKLQAQLRRTEIEKEEKAKGAAYRVAKAEATLMQTQQGLNDLRIHLKEAERELANTEILAPAPGMVVHREDFRTGQRRKPRVGDVPLKNQPLMDLPDLESMIVKARVREVDLSKIAKEKKATVYVDAFSNTNFPGEVTQIGILALSEIGHHQEEKYFEVRIALESKDRLLRPGMTARGTIHVQEVVDKIAIPTYAIYEEETGSYCYVNGGGKFQKRRLHLGAGNETWTEIAEGLNEGEYICLIPPE